MEGVTSSALDLLECMLLSPSMKPQRLPLQLLKDITSNFSDDQLIGNGGFAKVYKGLLQNGIVAVKKMENNFGFDEKAFLQEIGSLVTAKHPSIVRFLGYCGDTQQELMTHEGKHILAEDRQRLLCFEFLPGGSLRNHIADASRGLEWRPRYRIIKGICEGLNYLHENNIVHSDLKPENILLDDRMSPKIADFGLAMCFEKNQSRVTTDKPAGTLGYMAPEFLDGTITQKTDIFSLGVLIIEILTGQRGCLDIIENVDIETVVKNWSTRFETSQGGTEWLDHVRLCAEIGKECLNHNPEERPEAWCILERIHTMEHTSGLTTETDLCTSAAQVRSPLKKLCDDDVASKHLDVHPIALRFLFEPNKRTEFPVTLTNRTDHYAGVWITPVDHHGFPLLWDQKPLQGPVFHMIEPRTSVAVRVAMEKKRRHLPTGMSTIQVVMAVMGSRERLEMLKSFVDSMPHVNRYMLRIVEVVMVAIESVDCLEKLRSYFSWRNWKALLKTIEGKMVSTLGSKERVDSLRLYVCRMLSIEHDDVIKRMEQLGARVHREMLTAAAYYDHPAALISSDRKFISTSMFGNASGIDVHPTKPWILVGHDEGCVSIWNYETEEMEMMLKVAKADGSCYPVKSAKFIALEQWLAAGDANGYILVYDYNTTEKVAEFKAHDSSPVSSLAVQSTGSFMLTSSSVTLTSTKLWYWGQGWRCAREFDQKGGGVTHLTFNPREDTTFASISMDGDVKVWDTRISQPITTLQEKSTGACSFYTDISDRHLLLTSAISRADESCASAMIRDFQTQQVVHQLCIMGQWVRDVACHPTLPIAATVTTGRLIYFWNTRTYRVEKVVELNELPIRSMVFTGTDLARLIVPVSTGVSIVELHGYRGPIDNGGWN